MDVLSRTPFIMVTEGVTVLFAAPAFLSLYASVRVATSLPLVDVPAVIVGVADAERFPS